MDLDILVDLLYVQRRGRKDNGANGICIQLEARRDMSRADYTKPRPRRMFD